MFFPHMFDMIFESHRCTYEIEQKFLIDTQPGIVMEPAPLKLELPQPLYGFVFIARIEGARLSSLHLHLYQKRFFALNGFLLTSAVRR